MLKGVNFMLFFFSELKKKTLELYGWMHNQSERVKKAYYLERILEETTILKNLLKNQSKVKNT